MADTSTNIDLEPGEIEFVTYGEGPVRVAVMKGVVSEIIREKLANGRYERWEAATIQRILGRDEILLELGAGVGVISTLAWLTGNVKEVHCFEADPRLLPLIEATHAANAVKSSLHNAILATDDATLARGTVDFFIRENFYGSSMDSSVGREVRSMVAVPVRAFAQAVNAAQATIIACDIEGGERDLFRGASIPTVRRIMVETHQNALGGAGMRSLFDDLHRAGFHYDQRYSRGSVPVFSRV